MFTVFSLLAAADKLHEQLKQPLRPQEPKQINSYGVEEVEYSNLEASNTLAGTLTLPKVSIPSPAVILIAGSGPVDRDESVFGHKPFLVLADYLTKQGIAVLRVDKRGVGKSTGDYRTSTSEDLAYDVLAGIEFLKTREEVDKKKIGLIGHSEGGLIAPMVAIKSNDVTFTVLMAGTGVTGEAIVYEQEVMLSRSMRIDNEQLGLQLDLQKQVISLIKNEYDLEKAERMLLKIIEAHLAHYPKKDREISTDNIEAQIKRCNSKWFRYYLTYDPTHSLKHLKIPVLAVNGELDLQVSSKQNLSVIAKTLEKAGNQNYKIIEFPQLNHFFQTCESGSILEYPKIEETIAPIVLETLSDWILETTSNISS
ncbi:MAG: alpha/beta fold hydrolase [Chlamydiota bacterium]